MKKIVIFFIAVSLTSLHTPIAHAACVINGYYYSDTDQECIDWRGGVVAGSQTARTTSSSEIAELRRQIVELTYIVQQLVRLHGASGSGVQPTDTTYTPNIGASAVDIVTRSATRVDDDRATLRATLDLNREDAATVFFEYSTNRNNLTYESIHIVLDDRDDDDFDQQIRNLRDDTTYYFRAVARDERGRYDYGNIYSFTTEDDRRSRDDEPDVTTDDADNIDETTATLTGGVDMNDFEDGIVFVVYGEDEDQVEDIADEYDEYSDIDEDGDDLQKVLVASSLDTERDYEVRVRGLDPDTDYYFSFCVEYEDEDDDETIVCGDVEEFTTDE